MITINLIAAQIEVALDLLTEEGSPNRVDYDWGSVYKAGNIIRVDIKQIPEHSA